MGRPANANADQTRQRIVEAAIASFAKLGYHGTSTRDLGSASGVTISTLHYYFESKHGVFEAAMREAYARITQRIQRTIADPSVMAMLAQLSRPPLVLDRRALASIAERVYREVRQERPSVQMIMRQVIDEGQIEVSPSGAAETGDRWVEMLAKATSLPVQRVRGALLATLYLITRYLIQDDASLRRNLRLETDAEVPAAVADSIAATFAGHLVDPERG